MLRYLGFGWVLLAACGGETSSERHVWDSEARSAELSSDAALRVFDASVHDAGVFDAGHPDASTWLAAPEFSITLDSSSCYGACPHYWVRIDAAGKVSYRGRSNTARPGYFEIDLPAQEAQTLRRSLIDAGFIGLQDSYENEADGCSSVATDAPTKIFSLETPAQKKQVVFYEGCETNAAALFHTLEKQIMRSTQVGRFLYPAPLASCMRTGDRNLAVSWVISNDQGSSERKDLGLLRIEPDYTWRVTTCDGQEISSGSADLHRYWDRILISPYKKPGPIAWPGTEGPQGAVLLNRSSQEKWLRLSVLSLTEEQRQYAYEGDSCGGTPPPP